MSGVVFLISIPTEEFEYVLLNKTKHKLNDQQPEAVVAANICRKNCWTTERKAKKTNRKRDLNRTNSCDDLNTGFIESKDINYSGKSMKKVSK